MIVSFQRDLEVVRTASLPLLGCSFPSTGGHPEKAMKKFLSLETGDVQHGHADAVQSRVRSSRIDFIF